MGMRDIINDLLNHARRLRHHAEETAQPDYREKFLKLARQVEERATQIEASEPDDA